MQCIAIHSETGEEMVVYKTLYGEEKFYVRPLEMFMSPVDRNKYPEAEQNFRFEIYSEEENSSATPEVLKFLEAETYEDRLEALNKLGERTTNDMIDIMSTVVDIEIPEGEPAVRYNKFKNALETRRQFECGRLR